MVGIFANAVAAYNSAAARSAEPGLPARDRQSNPVPSFEAMVRDMVDSTVEANQRSEGVSLDALVGRADVNDVVLAVSNAEVGLQTVVAIRDRIIQAYQDIVRMPI